MEVDGLTEVPQNLQMLVRLVVRGFYSIEDVLIVDMLVRNLCMSEEDLCDLLKFDRKMLRQRINTLKADKLLQARMKVITLEDGKSQREQYYFINYKSFVNVVKYKLDHIRKKLEMEERDQTSRASFKCEYCQRTYTDLEADQLLDPLTGELLCVICRSEIQEDMSGLPRHDTRILLSRFNDQMEQLFVLLREVENIKLSAEFSEPRPQDFGDMKKSMLGRGDRKDNGALTDKSWSGDSSKNQGFQVDSSIDVNINSENGVEESMPVKEKPIWLTDASSFITANITSDLASNSATVTDSLSSQAKEDSGNKHDGSSDDVLKLLQQHERKSHKRKRADSDSSSSESGDDLSKKITNNSPFLMASANHSSGVSAKHSLIEEITISDDDNDFIGDSDEEEEPTISIGNQKIPITQVDNEAILKMTQEEKNQYITTYQEYCAALED